ncbi:acyl carrier protein [Streptomyces sp. NBC_00388]|uniref:acyl carrier protein n=1 Tax=Streptomyces sp. NBC_00388 TaxID=2975735 RepID=UPI002E2073A9
MQTTTRPADIQPRILDVLHKRFGDQVRALNPTADLATTLPGFDSLAALEYVTAVENEFGIEVDFVSDDVRYSFSTLERTTEYVRERVEDQLG